MRPRLQATLFLLLGFFIATTLFLGYLTLYEPERSPPPVHTSPEAQPLAQANETVVRSAPIIAVDQAGRGHVGTLRVKLIPGNNNVLIDTNPFLDIDIQYSANIAVTVAKLVSGRYASDKDFVLSYESMSQVVGGDSASAVTAVAVIAALEGRTFKEGYAMTGAVRQDGSIGRVGGVAEKAQALAQAGYTHFLVPKGQGTFTYYEPVAEPVRDPYGFVFYNTRYEPRTVDLIAVAEEEWGLTIIEVETVEEAAALLLS